MCANNYIDMNVDQIIKEIRKELTKRTINDKKINSDFNYDAPLSFYSATNLVSSQIKFPFLNFNQSLSPKENGEYHISDFLRNHQEEFVKNTYRAILGREADPRGLDSFLKRLNQGMSKIEIVGRIRYSPEGRKKGIKIRGLLIPLTAQMIYKIPVLGFIFRLAISLLRLPKALRDHLDFEHSSLYHNKIFQIQLKQNFEAIDNEFIKLSNVIAEQWNDLSVLTKELNRYNDLMDGLKESNIARDVQSDSRINKLSESVKQWGEAVKLIESKKAEKEELLLFAEQKVGKDETNQIQEEIKEVLKQIHDHKLNILDQDRRLRLLFKEARKRLPETISRKQIKEMLKEEDHLLDAMYVSLEDRIRGTREDIKKRLEVYLPRIQDVKAGSTTAPILDIGCGRGEWLELCKENNLEASGVDFNHVMVSRCVELGLDVVQEEALIHLKELKANKIGAITAFHFIEHISHKNLITFFDEAFRILKPGGIAIFETPNPENLAVGAFSFFIDPTHRTPLVPETMQALLEFRGFFNVKIMRLHKFQEVFNVTGDTKLEEKWLLGEMDYAVMGYKK